MVTLFLGRGDQYFFLFWFREVYLYQLRVSRGQGYINCLFTLLGGILRLLELGGFFQKFSVFFVYIWGSRLFGVFDLEGVVVYRVMGIREGRGFKRFLQGRGFVFFEEVWFQYWFFLEEDFFMGRRKNFKILQLGLYFFWVLGGWGQCRERDV